MKRCVILFISVCLLLVSLTFPISAQSMATAQTVRAGDRLPTGSFVKQLYDTLTEGFTAIANGERTSTSFELSSSQLSSLSWTAQQLQVDSLIQGSSLSPQAQQAVGAKIGQILQFERLTDCLLADCPYALYWYDKSSGGGSRYNYRISCNGTSVRVTSLTLSFTPIAAYKGSADYTVDPSKTKAAKEIAAYAKTVVQNNAAKSDLEKLEAYRAAVCNLVSYNHDAPNGPFGDAWQLIYVFDRNPSTNVVCEGYAKAFQHLCDLTTFSGNVTSYLVSGTMTGGTGAGGHMWNVVCINGTNYLVDVTNCDTGTVGATHKLFLVGAASSNNGRTHTVHCGNTDIVYTYHQDQADLFCDGYLKLSDQSVSSSATTTTTRKTTTTTKATTVTTKKTTTTQATSTTTQKPTTTIKSTTTAQKTTITTTLPSLGTTTTVSTQPSVNTTTTTTTVPPSVPSSTTETIPSTTDGAPSAPSTTASPHPDEAPFPVSIALSVGGGAVVLIVLWILIKRR